MANAIEILLNEAMKLERTEYLRAKPCSLVLRCAESTTTRTKLVRETAVHATEKNVQIILYWDLSAESSWKTLAGKRRKNRGNARAIQRKA